MNIAICDDEDLTARNLEHIVDAVLYNTTYDYNCKTFSSGDSLLTCLKKHPLHFQIYLLDIESSGRLMVLHLAEGSQIEYNGTLKEAAGKARGLTFAQAHNSHIVNLERIAKMDSHHLQMQSGAEIPVSGKLHGTFDAAYRNYILLKG